MKFHHILIFNAVVIDELQIICPHHSGIRASLAPLADESGENVLDFGFAALAAFQEVNEDPPALRGIEAGRISVSAEDRILFIGDLASGITVLLVAGNVVLGDTKCPIASLIFDEGLLVDEVGAAMLAVLDVDFHDSPWAFRRLDKAADVLYTVKTKLSETRSTAAPLCVDIDVAVTGQPLPAHNMVLAVWIMEPFLRAAAILEQLILHPIAGKRRW